MKKLSEDKLILIKKLIGLSGCVFGVLIMFLKFISYTSSSSLINGGDITMSSGVSLFSFLFNKNYAVFDGNVAILQDVFKYSYVLMWIVLILNIISIGILIAGIFIKKSLIAKIGSLISLISILLFITMIFDRDSTGNTVRYLNVFTWAYGLIFLFNGLGFMSTITLKDK